MWKNVHPVSSAGIQTHNLLITSLLSQPLDQGSRPKMSQLNLNKIAKSSALT